MFNESPACANKGDSDEQKSTLQSERETDTAMRDFILSHPLFCPGSLRQSVKPQTQTNALLFIILASAYPTTVKQMYLLTTVYHIAILRFIHNCKYMQSFPGGVIHSPL